MEVNCRTGARSRCYLANRIRFLQLHLPCFFKIDQVCGMFHMPRRGAARSKSVCGTRTQTKIPYLPRYFINLYATMSTGLSLNMEKFPSRIIPKVS